MATGVWLVAEHSWESQLDANEVEAALLDALRERVGVVVRFSGDSSLPACIREAAPVVACAPAPRKDALGIDLVVVMEAVENSSREDRFDARALRREALAALVLEQTPGGRERAVSLLTLALAQEPTAARRNDLAAALLLRGALDDRPIDWADALDLVGEASAAGEFFEAGFNRALALDLLTLRRSAVSAWSKLARNGAPRAIRRLASGWAESRSSALPGIQLEPDALALRRRGERLLGAWAASHLAGDLPAERRYLKQAAAAGVQHLRLTGDHLLQEAVAAIRDAAGDPRRVSLLARGHDAYDRARGDGLYAACVPALDAAERDLLAAGSPFMAWPRVDQAICAYFSKDFAEGYKRLRAAGGGAEARGHLAIAGRVHWITGLMRMLEGRFLEAEEALLAAAEHFRVLREPAHVAYLDALLSKALDSGGQSELAWRKRLAALSWRHRLGAERTFTVFEGAIESLKARGRPLAALVFLDEQVHAVMQGSGRSDDAGDVVALTLLDRAALRRELGLVAKAREDLDSTDQLWRSLPADAEIRHRIGLELAVERAALERPGSGASLAAIDEAVDFFGGGGSTEGDWIEVLRLLRLRARLQRESGNPAGAENDLRRAIAALERWRLDLEPGEQRARFLAHVRSTYDELLSLLVDTGRSEEALRFVERTSNRWWTEPEPRRARATPRRLDHLPDDTLILRYAHLRDRILVWTLDSQRIELSERRVGADVAQLVVTKCREAVRTLEASEPFCRRASDLFLPRRVSELPAEGRLVVVADDLMQALPFAALRAAPDQGYLAERFNLSFAPSALTLGGGGGEAGAGRALFVTDPAFDSRAYPKLRPLPSARRDAVRFAAHYRAHDELTGRGATRAALLTELPRVEVLHISAHGLEDPEAPERGGMLLAAAEGEDPGAAILSGRDIAAMSLPGLHLAVLAGCSTDPRSISGSGELSGLATGLLAAGAGAVVTTGWEVEDEFASELFAEFHRCHSVGGGDATCLRAAQLTFLRSADPERASPRSWAGYRVWEGEIPGPASVY